MTSLLEKRSPRRAIIAALVAVAVLAIGLIGWRLIPLHAPPSDEQAERFVKIGLQFQEQSPREPVSFFGPAALYPAAEDKTTLDALHSQMAMLAQEMEGASNPRRARLHERAKRLAALIALAAGDEKLSFDEEAKRLYGLDPATLDEAKFAQLRAKLDQLLPGDGSLTSRVQAFRERYIVPEELRPELFQRALDECRVRTKRHWSLPPEEKLYVEWNSYAGAAWHQYQGNFRSSLQINPQAVAFLGSIVDVACHEGYPGHHVQFLLREMDFGNGKLPLEEKVVFLRSPGSVVREGAADYGVSLAFPIEDRLVFERDVLFPLAHFPPEDAEHFEQVRSLLAQLAPAALPILRDYRDREISPAAAIAALDDKALIGSPQALLGFTDNLGAFVTGYTSVREQVRAAIEQGNPDEEERWSRLRALLGIADNVPLGVASDRLSVAGTEADD